MAKLTPRRKKAVKGYTGTNLLDEDGYMMLPPKSVRKTTKWKSRNEPGWRHP